MFSSPSLFAVVSLVMLMVCQTVVASPVMPFPLRRATDDLESRSLAADKHIREAAALPLDGIVGVHERQDIPDTVATMAPNGVIVPFSNPGHKRDEKRQIPDSIPTKAINGQVVPYSNPRKLRRASDRDVGRKRLEAKDVAEDVVD